MFNDIFLIFAASAFLGIAAMYLRQSLIVVYIVAGILVGPHVFSLIQTPEVVTEISNIGIIFLLFLLGMNLEPQDLIHLFKESTNTVAISSIGFFLTGLTVAYFFSFSIIDSVLIGCMCLFSSTIIGLKLMPTTHLHQLKMGEMMVSVLLLQDILAIVLLLVISALASGESILPALSKSLIMLPVIGAGAYLISTYVLKSIFIKFDQIREFTFLIIIAWCVTISKVSHDVGLSYEIGAFIAGVALASLPSARVMAEDLKPLRDFFLILFFFSVGASFDLASVYNPEIYMPAIVLAALLLIIKPLLFRDLIKFKDESKSREMALRLGQMSEFNLLVVSVAIASSVMSVDAGSVVVAATLITFIVSSTVIVSFLPTPVSSNKKLFKD
jgi:Kef-type K+ transport system membrane component KefB